VIRPAGRTALLLALTLAAAPAARAGDAADPDPAHPFRRGAVHAGLAGGFGPGFEPQDQAQDEIHLLAVLPRVGVGVTDVLFADAPYRSHFELALEGQLLADLRGDDGLGGAGVFLLRHHWLAPWPLVPFFEFGAGFGGIDFDGRQADGFQFVLQGGPGVQLFTDGRRAVQAQVRWHHLSNAGLRDPNVGIDTVLFLVGVSWYAR